MHPATQPLASAIGRGAGTSLSAALAAHPTWCPTPTSTTGRAMTLRFQLGHPAAALANTTWITLAYGALKRWRAFRGIRGGVSRQQWEGALAAALPHIQRLGINTIHLYHPATRDALFTAFNAFANVFPAGARPWVPISKSLHFLVPDLVVPVDTQHSESVLASLFDRAHWPQLTPHSFLQIYSFFAAVARAAGPVLAGLSTRITPTKMGLGRVVDLSVVGCLDHPVVTIRAWISRQFARHGVAVTPPQIRGAWRLTTVVPNKMIALRVGGRQRLHLASEIQRWTSQGNTGVWFKRYTLRGPRYVRDHQISLLVDLQ